MLSSSLWLRVIGYLTMAAAGASCAQQTRGTILSPPSVLLNAPGSLWQQGMGALVALAFAWLTIRTTRLLVAHTRWARRLHTSLRAELSGISSSQMVLLATLSACSEELLFRAALSPLFGFVVSSLLFGALHLPG
jgi:hypothetical protein